MSKKKSSSLPVIVFSILAVVWAIMVVVFYESLSAAEEERDRLAALEAEKSEELAKLKREVEHLRTYTDKMLKDSEFVQQEARERLGVAVEGEVVIRAEGN